MLAHPHGSALLCILCDLLLLLRQRHHRPNLFHHRQPFSVPHGMQVALTLLPLDEKTPGWAAKLTRYSLTRCIEYNDLELRLEDLEALRSGRPYVVGMPLHLAFIDSRHGIQLLLQHYFSRACRLEICLGWCADQSSSHAMHVWLEQPIECAGYEPHSALPTAMPMVFCEHSPLMPPALASARVLATSAVSKMCYF